MKTIKFRLLATIITLAAVLTATNTTEAQRKNESSTDNTQKIREDRRITVREKNNSRDNAYEKNAEVRKVNSQREVTRNQRSQSENLKSSGNHQEYSRVQTNKNENRNETRSRSGISSSADYRSASKEMIQRNRDYISGNTERTKNQFRSSERERYNNSDNRDQHKYNNEYANNSRAGRTSGVTNREKYRLDNDEERYRPNRNYRGNDKYWSTEIRNNHHNHGKKVKNGHYNHWDHNWEYYRWNVDSWRNYYSYYDPYSYRNYRYYYHHPHYGHVVRKFSAPPMVFIHNHHKYYCYDGHFFSYRPGIGYILVDMPFGVTFAIIPDNYDTVYINGYMYYRVGNLFLEYTPSGYQLVHYPERYYAYDDRYINGGFSFEFSIN
jgi:hypothetical protein